MNFRASPIARLFATIPASVRGVMFMALAAMCFSFMHAGVRHVSADMHPFEIAFLRNLFGLIVLLPWLVRVGLTHLRTERLRLHALRGALQAVAMLAFFTGLSLAPLAQVSALSFSAPLFATLGAIVIVGEVVRLRRWTAIVVGFAGTLVIVHPGLEAFNVGWILVLFSSALWGTAIVVTKVLARTESSVTIAAYMGLFLTPLSLLPAVFVWHWPSVDQLLWLAVIGALGSSGHLAMAQALKEADATAVLPIDFTRLIWAAAIGYLAFAEIPEVWTWLGGIVIFASTTYITYREARIRAEPVPVAAAGRAPD